MEEELIDESAEEKIEIEDSAELVMKFKNLLHVINEPDKTEEMQHYSEPYAKYY
jgi:hypothetical protein